MKKPELLLPAGNIEKMKYALHHGADAVYLGTTEYSLRSMKMGDIITRSNLPEAIKIAHDINKKIYVTLNIFPNNNDVEKIPEFIEYLSDVKPDAIIFSDIGVGSLVKKYAPNIPLHLSTQANTSNYITARAWQDFGVERIILARELSLKEIETIKQKVPDLELEVFIHGSLCISFSGRCILSDYMTDNKRKSNKGECAQPCRWKFALVEQTRPGEYYEITEDDHGTYIMNAKDLCLAGHIKALMNAGVDSLKVEGRTKSVYYVSIIAKTYKEIINKILNNKEINVQHYIEELGSVGNRGFTENFIQDKPTNLDYNYETSKGKAGLTFLATTISDTITHNKILVRARNQFKLFDEVEWVTPDACFKSKIEVIESTKDQKLSVANTNNEVYINYPPQIKNFKWAIIRSTR